MIRIAQRRFMPLQPTRRPHPPVLPTPRLPRVHVHDFDSVVPVAQPVPWWDVGLDVARCVRRARTEGLAAGPLGVPFERPVLPLVRTLGLLHVSGIPVAFA